MAKNLIIIIGNGFDVAHGMKTRFNDFAGNILEKVVSDLESFRAEHSIPKDSLIREQFYNTLEAKRGKPLQYTTSGNDYQRITHSLANASSKEDIRVQVNSNIPYNQMFKNSLIASLFSDSYENWFDIERAYFFELSKLLSSYERYQERHEKFPARQVENLNKNFDEIRALLIDYLKTIKVVKKDSIEAFFRNQILNQYRKCILVNFNYTNTIEQYKFTLSSAELISEHYIHGTLDEENIVFGYGDDTNDRYFKMKSSGIDEFLRHFKTFHYLMNSEYKSLIEELKITGPYDAMVLGHSLGTTDKSLLQFILDSKKCQQIRIYKRLDLLKEDYEACRLNLEREFNKLTYALSRIITNEIELRDKVVDFSKSDFFPLREGG